MKSDEILGKKLFDTLLNEKPLFSKQLHYTTLCQIAAKEEWTYSDFLENALRKEAEDKELRKVVKRKGDTNKYSKALSHQGCSLSMRLGTFPSQEIRPTTFFRSLLKGMRKDRRF